ncbi:MAG: DUF3656 domain-containing protein [Bacteroidales bacterium]|nr:DUF3656 domain-containing protein [Bacteroidales bacterium]
MYLELLSPARNLDIGIAAIDSGADAVYIGGPFFGARKDAGNSVEDIAALCSYAHRFGARVFVTFNISVSEEEIPEMHSMMLACQDAGADAFIVRDERIFGWKDITVPLHASTQCAIRTVEDARRYEALGAARLVLERELSLADIKAIREAVSCELECFVHGALCVCYSGDCRLSEYLDGRSADRGECIQACRSLYDLVDASGRVLVHDKALLSLRDFNLLARLQELADAGVCSFKIEGRLKNAAYVRNVTRAYSLAVDGLCEESDFTRASFGRVSGGFTPDLSKTFNRGYTELYFDGKRSHDWSSMDAPANLGTLVGTVRRLRRDRSGLEITLSGPIPELHNGDGFTFLKGASIVGFRGDVCEGNTIRCQSADGLREGMRLYRNIDAVFTRELEKNLPKREIPVSLEVSVSGGGSGKWDIVLRASSQDGRIVESSFKADVDTAENRARAAAMFHEQLGKRSGHYIFSLDRLDARELPLLATGTLNSMRRLLAEDLDAQPCGRVPMAAGNPAGETIVGEPCQKGPKTSDPPEKNAGGPSKSAENARAAEPLMRTRYCIRYELGLCPVHQGAKDTGPLFLLNNGRRLALGFDCSRCEMTVSAAR